MSEDVAEELGTAENPIDITADKENDPGKEKEPEMVLGRSYDARNEWRIQNIRHLHEPDFEGDFESWRHEAQVDYFTEGLECMKCKTYTSFYCCNCEATVCEPCGHSVGDCSIMCVHCFARLCNAFDRNIVHGLPGELGHIMRSYPLQFNKRDGRA